MAMAVDPNLTHRQISRLPPGLTTVLKLVQTLNMVQEEVTPPPGRRERNRLERHRSFLRTAQAIVAAEGLDALTMQRLAAELDCAVGTAYTYFSSKSALVAELQRDAIQTLHESYLRLRVRADAAGGDLTPAVAALAQVVGFGRFCHAIFTTHPEEARLLQLLMAEPGRSVIADADVGTVVPTAMRLLDHARVALDAAVAAGALHPGDGLERTIRLVAALNGVLLLDRLVRVDAELFDTGRHVVALLDDLLLAWGADPAALAAAERRVDDLAATGPLAPTVDREVATR
jgi:AcrR family transcriptional regulator